MRKRYVVLGLSGVLALALAVPALGGPSNPVAEVSANAKKTAKRAIKKAKTAQSTADQALSDAASAQNSADTAQTTADGASTAAAAAQTAADAAQATADSKFGDVVPRGGTSVGPDSTSPKQVVATCQAGEEVTGGGWFTGGAGSDNLSAPQFNAAYISGWITTIEEIEGGTAENWSLGPQVECAQTE